jgi:ferritin-like metal-binding protein YciE
LEFLLGCKASHESSSENEGTATTEELHTAIEEHIAQIEGHVTRLEQLFEFLVKTTGSKITLSD